MNNKPTLYELTGKYLELLTLAEECETEEDLQAFQDTFESLDATLNDKFEGCCQVIKELEGKITVLSDEIGRLSTRKKTIQNSIDNLKFYMKKNMESLDVDKVDTGLFNIRIAKNGGKRKLTVRVEPKDLPQKYQKITIGSNTSAIRDDIRKVNINGYEADCLINENNGDILAVLEPQGESLRIR